MNLVIKNIETNTLIETESGMTTSEFRNCCKTKATINHPNGKLDFEERSINYKVISAI